MTIFYNARHLLNKCLHLFNCYFLENLWNGKFSTENPCFNLNSWFLNVIFCLYHVRIEGGGICFFGIS